MKAIEIKTELKNYLESKLNCYVPFSISETKFGTSIYIQNVGVGKIRISDHSVTNINRIWDEVHFNLNSILNNLENLLLHVEMILFPERFEKKIIEVESTHFTKNVYKSMESFYLGTKNATIIKTTEFTNKKGISKIEVEYSYPTTEKKVITIRK